MKFNKVQKLYSGVIPSYFAALFTPLVLVPLVGDIVVNSIFILIVMLILQRKVPVKLYFKTVLVSYGIALGGFILAIMCSMGGEMQHGFIDIKPDGSNIINKAIFVYVGFFVSLVFLFIGHFKVTFGKSIIKILWQRIVFALVLSAFNAPYLIFISIQLLKDWGYYDYFGVV